MCSFCQKFDSRANPAGSHANTSPIQSTAGQPTTEHKILAPSDGLLLARDVSDGQKLDKGTELFRIANLARVWVLADSFAKDAGDLTPGRAARVSTAGTARNVAARISEVPPQFDPNSQTLKIRLEEDNPGYALRADMFVESSTGGAWL